MYRLKLFAILIITQAFTQVFATVNVIYNPEDSVEIERWLSEAPSGKTPNELTLYFANKMIGRPYVAHTLERSDSECLIINMKELDCTTLVENSAAMAITAKQGKKRFSDYCDVLRSLRYRNGEITDYSSRLHYFSEWIKYNEEKGLVEDIGKKGAYPFIAKQIIKADFMSTNPQYYKQLKNDTAMVAKIKEAEMRISGTAVNYIPKSLLNNGKDLLGDIKDGDIIALITNKKGLEISHVGIAVWKNGKLHLLNASSLKHKVILDTQTLYEYQKTRKSQLGIRVIRVY